MVIIEPGSGHVRGCNCPTGEKNCVYANLKQFQSNHYFCPDADSIKPKPHAKYMGKSPWARTKKR